MEADRRSIERQETAESYVRTLRTHYVRNRFTGVNVRIQDPECSFSFSVGRSGDIWSSVALISNIGLLTAEALTGKPNDYLPCELWFSLGE